MKRFPETLVTHNHPSPELLQRNDSISDLFIRRPSDIVDVELGFFALEDAEQREARRVRGDKWFKLAVTLLVASGVVAWLFALIIVLRA